MTHPTPDSPLPDLFGVPLLVVPGAVGGGFSHRRKDMLASTCSPAVARIDAEAAAIVREAHKTANNCAQDLDGTFFGRNRHRRFHIRPSLPFEGDNWTIDTHLQFPQMIVEVRFAPGGRAEFYDRHPISSDVEIPDEDAALERIWMRVRQVCASDDYQRNQRIRLPIDEIRALVAGEA